MRYEDFTARGISMKPCIYVGIMDNDVATGGGDSAKACAADKVHREHGACKCTQAWPEPTRFQDAREKHQ